MPNIDTLGFLNYHIGRQQDLGISKNFLNQSDPHDLRVTKWGQTSKSAPRVQIYEFIKNSQKLQCCALRCVLINLVFRQSLILTECVLQFKQNTKIAM